MAGTADPSGVKVGRVVDGGTAGLLGLKVGDVITRFDGEAVKSPAELVADAHKLNSGDDVAVTFLRDGKEQSASAKMVGRPKVTEQDLDVIYDQVESEGKRIRVIITKPKADGKYPTIFLIGGIGAYSVDAPFASMPYGNVLAPIMKSQKYVLVRIDKPGQGDSEGPAYTKLTFNAEADAYVQALRLAKTLPYVDADRIAIYGHSMGGCFGPVVAAQEHVKAVIANGTIFGSFDEYMLENGRRQSELSKTPEDELDTQQKQLAAVDYFIFDLDQTPAQVSKDHPELAAYVKQTFPDGETFSGVGIPFFQDLEHTNLAKAWKDSKCDVLAIYGENDFLSGRADHERIAAYVNALRPGTAEFKLIPNCDHVFTRTTSMADSLAKWGKGGEFNPEIIQILGDYFKKELAPGG